MFRSPVAYRLLSYYIKVVYYCKRPMFLLLFIRHVFDLVLGIDTALREIAWSIAHMVLGELSQNQALKALSLCFTHLLILSGR